MSRVYEKIAEHLVVIRDSTNGLTKEQSECLTEAADIIADYEAAVTTTARIQKKYETPAPAIGRGMNYWQCPECTGKIQEKDGYCHWCGKAILWEKRRKKKR